MKHAPAFERSYYAGLLCSAPAEARRVNHWVNTDVPAGHQVNRHQMDKTPSTQPKEETVPKVVKYTAIASIILAVILSGRLCSAVSKGQGGGHDGFVSLDLIMTIAFFLFLLVFFFTLWAPVLGVTLVFCKILPSGKPYYRPKAWNLFIVLMLPFIVCLYFLLNISAFHQLVHP